MTAATASAQQVLALLQPLPKAPSVEVAGRVQRAAALCTAASPGLDARDSALGRALVRAFAAYQPTARASGAAAAAAEDEALAVVWAAIVAGGGAQWVNAADDHGLTPLYTAALRHNDSAIALLLRSGADANTAHLHRLLPDADPDAVAAAVADSAAGTAAAGTAADAVAWPPTPLLAYLLTPPPPSPPTTGSGSGGGSGVAGADDGVWWRVATVVALCGAMDSAALDAVTPVAVADHPRLRLTAPPELKAKAKAKGKPDAEVMQAAVPLPVSPPPTSPLPPMAWPLRRDVRHDLSRRDDARSYRYLSALQVMAKRDTATPGGMLLTAALEALFTRDRCALPWDWAVRIERADGDGRSRAWSLPRRSRLVSSAAPHVDGGVASVGGGGAGGAGTGGGGGGGGAGAAPAVPPMRARGHAQLWLEALDDPEVFDAAVDCSTRRRVDPSSAAAAARAGAAGDTRDWLLPERLAAYWRGTRGARKRVLQLALTAAIDRDGSGSGSGDAAAACGDASSTGSGGGRAEATSAAASAAPAAPAASATPPPKAPFGALWCPPPPERLWYDPPQPKALAAALERSRAAAGVCLQLCCEYVFGPRDRSAFSRRVGVFDGLTIYSSDASGAGDSGGGGSGKSQRSGGSGKGKGNKGGSGKGSSGFLYGGNGGLSYGGFGGGRFGGGYGQSREPDVGVQRALALAQAHGAVVTSDSANASVEVLRDGRNSAPSAAAVARALAARYPSRDARAWADALCADAKVELNAQAVAAAQELAGLAADDLYRPSAEANAKAAAEDAKAAAEKGVFAWSGLLACSDAGADRSAVVSPQWVGACVALGRVLNPSECLEALPYFAPHHRPARPRASASDHDDVDDDDDDDASSRAGLQFPVRRIHRALRGAAGVPFVRRTAAVVTAAALEYVTAELLETAGNACRAARVQRIEPQHLLTPLHTDIELTELIDRLATDAAAHGHFESAAGHTPSRTDPTANPPAAAPPAAPATATTAMASDTKAGDRRGGVATAPARRWAQLTPHEAQRQFPVCLYPRTQPLAPTAAAALASDDTKRPSAAEMAAERARFDAAAAGVGARVYSKVWAWRHTWYDGTQSTTAARDAEADGDGDDAARDRIDIEGSPLLPLMGSDPGHDPAGATRRAWIFGPGDDPSDGLDTGDGDDDDDDDDHEDDGDGTGTGGDDCEGDSENEHSDAGVALVRDRPLTRLSDYYRVCDAPVLHTRHDDRRSRAARLFADRICAPPTSDTNRDGDGDGDGDGGRDSDCDGGGDGDGKDTLEMDYGEDDGCRSYHEAHPLHAACALNDVAAVRRALALVNASELLREFDGEGLQPLHVAAMHGHARCVRALVAAGADPTVPHRCPPDDPEFMRWTAFHEAWIQPRRPALLRALRSGRKRNTQTETETGKASDRETGMTDDGEGDRDRDRSDWHFPYYSPLNTLWALPHLRRVLPGQPALALLALQYVVWAPATFADVSDAEGDGGDGDCDRCGMTRADAGAAPPPSRAALRLVRHSEFLQLMTCEPLENTPHLAALSSALRRGPGCAGAIGPGTVGRFQLLAAEPADDGVARDERVRWGMFLVLGAAQCAAETGAATAAAVASAQQLTRLTSDLVVALAEAEREWRDDPPSGAPATAAPATIAAAADVTAASGTGGAATVAAPEPSPFATPFVFDVSPAAAAPAAASPAAESWSFSFSMAQAAEGAAVGTADPAATAVFDAFAGATFPAEVRGESSAAPLFGRGAASAAASAPTADADEPSDRETSDFTYSFEAKAAPRRPAERVARWLQDGPLVGTAQRLWPLHPAEPRHPSSMPSAVPSAAPTSAPTTATSTSREVLRGLKRRCNALNAAVRALSAATGELDAVFTRVSVGVTGALGSAADDGSRIGGSIAAKPRDAAASAALTARINAAPERYEILWAGARAPHDIFAAPPKRAAAAPATASAADAGGAKAAQPAHALAGVVVRVPLFRCDDGAGSGLAQPQFGQVFAHIRFADGDDALAVGHPQIVFRAVDPLQQSTATALCAFFRVVCARKYATHLPASDQVSRRRYGPPSLVDDTPARASAAAKERQRDRRKRRARARRLLEEDGVGADDSQSDSSDGDVGEGHDDPSADDWYRDPPPHARGQGRYNDPFNRPYQK